MILKTSTHGKHSLILQLVIMDNGLGVVRMKDTEIDNTEIAMPQESFSVR